MTERKEPIRHPSTMIPDSVVQEINYRTFLLLLEPSLTPEESRARSHTKIVKGREIVQDDASRRALSAGQMALTRVYLRVLVDLGVITEIVP